MIRKSAMLIVYFIVLFLLSGPAPAEEAVVARVNGAAILQTELEQAVDKLIPRATFHGSVSNEKRDEFREKALEDLIIRELQYQDALAKGMKPEKKQVKEQMKTIRDRFSSKKDYKKALNQAGLTEDQLQSRVEKDVLVAQVIAKITIEPSQLTPAEVQGHYEKNSDKFKQPESVRLRIISAKAEVKAKEALSKAAGGGDFGEIAARMSEDNYRVKGGDIGYVHRGRLYPELENAAFNMKAGAIGGPINAEGTWFIIKVEDKLPERQLSFEEVKNKLKKELEAKRSGELMEKWMGELKSKAKIEIVSVPATRKRAAE